MIERAYHSELIDIYRRAAHIWRITKPIKGDNTVCFFTNTARKYANWAMEFVVHVIDSDSAFDRESALYYGGSWVNVAERYWLEMGMLTMTIDDIAAVCNNIVPLTPPPAE